MDRNLKIGVVGLGLMGGSIFKALSALKCNVYGVSRSKETAEKASAYNENVSQNLSFLENCDVIFVCTHMNVTEKVLEELDNIVNATTIVTDVCSLKEFIAKDNYKFSFIPSHPMAGTEYSGFTNAFESMFQGAKWVLTPFENTKNDDLKKLTDIIEVLGSIPVISTPKEHDEAVAMISHMPMVLSQALYKAASKNELAMKLASSGFRDMTRLALSNSEMAVDMVTLNDKNIQKALLHLYANIGELLESDYHSQIENIKTDRAKMYSKYGKNQI